MIKISILVSTLFISTQLIAQNLYSRKLNSCITAHFCLDCGDVKANVDKEKFEMLVTNLTASNNLKGINGKIKFQILVDSTGKGCVLSHTDLSDNIITKNIVAALNKFDGFIPAKSNEENVERSSFDILFEIEGRAINGRVVRVDQEAFMKSFDIPNSPKIDNKKYFYKNENLKDYKITVWNSRNSNLSNNWNDNIAVDKKGIIWLTIRGGLVTFDGNKFNNAEQNIKEKGKYFHYGSIAVDNENTKWVSGKGNIYSYKEGAWKINDSIEYDLSGFQNIISSPKTSEMFFCTSNGLKVYKNGEWIDFNKDKITELPTKRVTFANRDSKNRIWISTFSGSVLIDENGKSRSLNETIFKGKCINAMDEDENGNLYFSLIEYESKTEGKLVSHNYKNGGLGILYSNGIAKKLTVENSGMPVNAISSLLYDKNEKVLWISTKTAGLVRYNLNDSWENYHSDNSKIPTSFISAMTFDNDGKLYLATRQGLVRVERQ